MDEWKNERTEGDWPSEVVAGTAPAEEDDGYLSPVRFATRETVYEQPKMSPKGPPQVSFPRRDWAPIFEAIPTIY